MSDSPLNSGDGIDSTLFSSSKWAIIAILGKKPSSPLQIANQLKTSIANVSQQLKILEAYRIVKKERTSNSGPGKPRTIYRIANPKAFIALSSPSNPTKALVTLEPYEELLVNIWSQSKGEQKRALSRWANKVDSLLCKIHYIGITSHNEKIKLIIITHDNTLGKLKNICTKSFLGINSISYRIVSRVKWQEKNGSTSPDNLICLHRLPNFTINKTNEKDGEE